MDSQVLRRLPKIELHLHLEGAIPLPALWQLVQKYGGTPEVPNLDALKQKFQFRDFGHFIDTWVWKNNFIREYEDFTLIADAVAASLVEQGIIYSELMFSPGDFARHGLELGPITAAIRRGLQRHESKITTPLILDLIRDFGPEKGRRWLDEGFEVRDLGIVGIGIGGSEGPYPPEAYGDIYHRARQLGFHTTAHAGEAAGAASVWGAVQSLGVERIGHGTRAVEDPALLRYLQEHQIAIEACPISNVRTAVVKSLRDHPIKQFLDEGLLVCVNTDDPAMFHTSLEEEFRALHETFGFGLREVKKLTLNAITASFASHELKQKLKIEVEQAYAGQTEK